MSSLAAIPTTSSGTRKPADTPVPDRVSGPTGASAWRYERRERPWIMLAFSLFISASLHAVLLYGFNRPKIVEKAVVVEEPEYVQIVMPELKEEEPDKVEELGETMDETPAVAVPMLADAPSVTVSAFVQPLQYVPDVASNLQATKVSQIPVNIARGGRSLASLGQIFEVNQLDRVPTPIAQPSPVFPFHLKQQYSSASVIVEFIVTDAGEVVNVTASQAVHRDFEDAAINGVSKWRFRPGMKGGKRVHTRVRVPLNFVLQDE